MAMLRTNLTLPEELMREVDDLAGPRGRSAFVAEAIAYKVTREKLRRAIEETAGALVGKPRVDDSRWGLPLGREQREWGNEQEG